MIHEIKILKQFADEIISGNKNFEVRKNDRGYQKGDLIKFNAIQKTVNIEIGGIKHPISEELYEITYVLSWWGIEIDYVVFGIKPKE